MLGEIQLELGAYDDARPHVRHAATPSAASLAVAPRYARWEEIRGRPAEARRLLRLARDEAIDAACHARRPARVVPLAPR